jgi:hypothetical protein
LPVGEGAGEEGSDAASERADGEGDADAAADAPAAAAAAAGPQVQGRASRSATARSLSGRGNGGETKKAAAPSQPKSSECSPCEFSWDKENRREEAERARQYVYQWECRREGLAPLTIEELRRHGLRAQNQPPAL